MPVSGSESTTTTLRAVQLLPPHLINRIAAGEVVERPASVVKELVENSLDAGASHIAIAVGAGGRSIRIADNGHGMRPDDAKMAFYNHATSKVHNEEELERIHTLGFRGEALASVASISKMSCTTRTADAAHGVRVTIDETGEPTLTEAGCAPGTVMVVDDLFYNTPARLKFLKRPQTELSHIEETVQFLALSHPNVRFSLKLNEKETLSTSGSGALKSTLEELFPISRERIQLIPVSFGEDPDGTENVDGEFSLAGYASEPGFMKSSKRWVMTFVNGRHVRCAILQKSIEAAYESLLPHGRYPLTALFLSIPPQDVDVNVHPTKREVRYLESNRVFGFVKTALRRSMSAHGITMATSTPFPATPISTVLPLSDTAQTQNIEHFASPVSNDVSFTLSQDNHSETQNSHSNLNPAFTSHSPESVETNRDRQLSQSFPAGTYNPHPQTYASPKFQPSRLSDESSQQALSFYKPNNSGQNHQISDSPGTVTNESGLQAETRFKVIGQLFNTYILMETPQGLLVVDQHIASERTFFEALTLNLTGGSPLIQRQLTSTPIALTPLQKDLLARHQEEFVKLGFLYSINPETENAVLEGYPLVYEGRDGLSKSGGTGGLFENLLVQLEETGEMKLDLDPLIATLSCHSAVRAGDTLSYDDMNTVISRWLACQLPWTCPHGRPIAHTISKNELNRFFHRTSLPVGTD